MRPVFDHAVTEPESLGFPAVERNPPQSRSYPAGIGPCRTKIAHQLVEEGEQFGSQQPDDQQHRRRQKPGRSAVDTGSAPYRRRDHRQRHQRQARLRKQRDHEKARDPHHAPWQAAFLRRDEDADHRDHSRRRGPRGEELPARRARPRFDRIEDRGEIFGARTADRLERRHPQHFRQAEKGRGDKHRQHEQRPHAQPTQRAGDHFQSYVEHGSRQREQRDQRPALCPADRALDGLPGAEREVRMADPQDYQHGQHRRQPQPDRRGNRREVLAAEVELGEHQARQQPADHRARDIQAPDQPQQPGRRDGPND